MVAMAQGEPVGRSLDTQGLPLQASLQAEFALQSGRLATDSGRPLP